MLFSGPDNPDKLPLSVANLDPHLIHGSLGLPEFTLDPIGISTGSAVFAGLTNVDRQSYTQRDHTTSSVATSRI